MVVLKVHNTKLDLIAFNHELHFVASDDGSGTAFIVARSSTHLQHIKDCRSNAEHSSNGPVGQDRRLSVLHLPLSGIRKREVRLLYAR
jgi:hypothetical protein